MRQKIKPYVIGLDYGTNSCRAVLMKIDSSQELTSATFNYPSGEMGVLGDESDPHLARQDPADNIDGMTYTIRNVLNNAAKTIPEFQSDQVGAIGFATTGSTVIPVDSRNQALAFSERFKDNLNAKAWLWKDHSSFKEADSISQMAQLSRPEFLASCGGRYSSEWFWAKIWHLKNIDEEVFNAAYSYLELCDYLPSVLAGITDPLMVKRSLCAAGHKALYSENWGGLPDKEFLSQCDPALAQLRDRLYSKAYASDHTAGVVDKQWATKTGLSQGTQLAVGGFDAHLGAVGAGIKEGSLIKIMGTSTCDLMISNSEQTIEGVCGTAMHSVIPGFVGIEAGQSAVGDIFLWFVNNLVPASYGSNQDEIFNNLNRAAAELNPGQSGLVALDWNNGNRCVLSDMQLSGLLIGQTLHTRAHEIYRALIEATAFGALKIIERLDTSGAPVGEIICCGGLAQKNPMMMQIYADVTGRDIRVVDTEQTCAVGAAISAASIVSGKSLAELQQTMTSSGGIVYRPEEKSTAVYKKLYALYAQLHDSFGVDGVSIDHFELMKSLHTIRKESSNPPVL